MLRQIHSRRPRVVSHWSRATAPTILPAPLQLGGTPPAESLTLDVRHGVPELAGCVPRIEHGQDVWVLKRSCCADLMQEAFGTQSRRQLRVEDLEGDQPFVPKVAGEIDHGHAAPAELALDVVAVTQGILKSGGVDQGTSEVSPELCEGLRVTTSELRATWAGPRPGFPRGSPPTG